MNVATSVAGLKKEERMVRSCRIIHEQAPPCNRSFEGPPGEKAPGRHQGVTGVGSDMG